MDKKKLVILLIFVTIFCLHFTLEAAPKGAKALFDSGEGPATGVYVAPTTRTTESAPVQKQKYVGISYELLLLTDDGQIKKVSKNRVFKSGERLIMRVMTNRPGNLRIVNIGPTGKNNVLFDDFVDAYMVQQIPKGSNLRFVGDPGTETIIITLSDTSMPTGTPSGNITAGGSQPPNNYNQPGSQNPPFNDSRQIDVSQIASNIDGAKRIKGAKDIVVEDQMQSTYAVVSPANNWKPVQTGAKDIVVESSQGTNYGVVPVSALSNGGAFSLMIKLKHK